MRGSIKLGRRWMPFRARQVVAPHHGFVWAAHVASVVVGSDQYADGKGWMSWKLLGLVPLVRAEGPDVSRSAAGRGGGEAISVPTALLPRFGVTWSADDEAHVTARYAHEDVDVAFHLALNDDAHIESAMFKRWGDPAETGTWGLHPFGVDVTAHATFDGVTIRAPGASAGSTAPIVGPTASSSATRSPSCIPSPRAAELRPRPPPTMS